MAMFMSIVTDDHDGSATISFFPTLDVGIKDDFTINTTYDCFRANSQHSSQLLLRMNVS